MKTLFFAALFFAVHVCHGQDEPKMITPQILNTITTDIEKQIPSIKQRFVEQEFTSDQIEFALDTFRINQTVLKRMDIDYSTAGMNTTITSMRASYDKLLNKYYTKLLKILAPEDKKSLIAAQKAWVAYRDAEQNLIVTLSKDKYSGGGTIQSITANSDYSDIIVKRTIEIFNYYDGVIKDN